MFRGTLRPFARQAPVLRGLRVTFFYDKDNYVMNAERTRLLGAVHFEHQYINGGVNILNALDQSTALGVSPLNKEGRGYSIWVTPKQSTGNVGWEGFLRYDHVVPDTRSLTVTGRPLPTTSRSETGRPWAWRTGSRTWPARQRH